jgi:hypothetical protein
MTPSVAGVDDAGRLTPAAFFRIVAGHWKALIVFRSVLGDPAMFYPFVLPVRLTGRSAFAMTDAGVGFVGV